VAIGVGIGACVEGIGGRVCPIVLVESSGLPPMPPWGFPPSSPGLDCPAAEGASTKVRVVIVMVVKPIRTSLRNSRRPIFIPPWSVDSSLIF
jgi:hypothetical protein